MAVSELLIEKVEMDKVKPAIYLCKKQRDYDYLIEKLAEYGIYWESRYLEDTHWSRFKQNTIIVITEKGNLFYGDLNNRPLEIGEKIIRFKAPKKMYVLKSKSGSYYEKTIGLTTGQELKWSVSFKKETATQFTKKTAKELKRVLGCEMDEA